jgi:hypothetical protein
LKQIWIEMSPAPEPGTIGDRACSPRSKIGEGYVRCGYISTEGLQDFGQGLVMKAFAVTGLWLAASLVLVTAKPI